MTSHEPFRVGLTRDFLKADGSNSWGDIGLGLLDAAPNVTWEYLPEATRELRPDQIAGYDGLLVLGARVSAATLAGSARLGIVARFGVGYDTVDLDACTAAGVAVTITPDGVRRAMASTALTLVLALGHRLRLKDQITRAGRWHDRLDLMGVGLAGKTLGLVGCGNIGRDLLGLVAPFGMRRLVADPYASRTDAAAHDYTLMPLDEMLPQADFVIVCCALTPETYHLLDDRRLRLLKPSAFVVNIARGPIIDEPALIDALQAGRLKGAGLDVFEQEPVDPHNPLLTLENTILGPHALGWTDELALGNGTSAVNNLLACARGEAPTNVVNRAVLDTPRFRDKLAHRR